jgi:hypothetical protein
MKDDNDGKNGMSPAPMPMLFVGVRFARLSLSGLSENDNISQ